MSDILIKGVEMPTTCHCCRMCVQVSDGDIDWHWECCLLCEEVARYATDRIPGCPLVPVPPHGDLIDRDALMNSDGDVWDGMWGWSGVKIMDAPTIIPASFENPTKNARYSQDNTAEEGE